MKCFHTKNIFFYLINANLKPTKQILYHIREIRQIKYKNKVWFFLQFLAFEGIIDCVLYVIKISMKKIFMRLWQWILKYKKRLIYWALALFIGQICFFNLWWIGINNVVYADEPGGWSLITSFQNRATVWLEDLSFLERGCYVLLYPILILAWALVNNSWVYAEVFQFDAVLWKLWNIVRNLANYALWLIFVFKIFQYLIDEKKAWKLFDIIKSSLIAWIGIQASWFLLAVLIDISNVLTYSVGWLPIHILGTQDLWDETNFWNPYVFQTAISYDLEDPDSLYFYLSNTSSGWTAWNNYIAECETFSFDDEGKAEELIVAPKIIYYSDWKNYYPTKQNMCHVWDDVFYLWGFTEGIEWQSCSDKNTCKNAQIKYNESVDNAIEKLKQKNKGWIMWDITAWNILQVKNAHLTWSDIWHRYPGETPWLDVNGEKTWRERNMRRMHDILEGDDGYVWVFSALYSSLLNAGNVFRAHDTWIYVSLLSKILSFCHTLAVGIPLIAMLLVFVMRIGIIWMAIILSPAIILLSVFKVGNESMLNKLCKNNKVLKYLTIENLIWIIFSPAVICFAVSISTVLVRIINTVTAEHIMTEKTSVLWWLIELNLGWLRVDLWKLICSVIWVAISWFLIRSAIRASELWKSDLISWQNGDKWLKALVWSALWSIPIVPIPKVGGWIDFVWTRTAFWSSSSWQQSIFTQWSRNLMNEYNNQDMDAVSALFNSKGRGQTSQEAAANQLSAYTSWLIGKSIADITAWDWWEMVISIWEWNSKQKRVFNDFNNWEKEKIIQAINGIGNEDLRKAFGDSKPSIIVWSNTYNFDASEKKYKQQNTNTPSSS